MSNDARTLHEHLLRELTPQVLAIVARRCDDFAAAEDAVQEALIAAAQQWPRDGLPENPRAWLIHVALRRITDHIRSEIARRRREEDVAQDALRVVQAAEPDPDSAHDDVLDLLFMCCHPALSPASAIALTLRAVCGLTTAEISHAFLVPEATIAQRISRAKASIKAAGAVFERPSASVRTQHLQAVLHVLYLMFNEGYASSGGPELQRSDLTQEALRLSRLVHTLQPDDTEAAGLLALMLLTDARRLARSTATGDLIALPMQDRALWDHAQITEGVALISLTLPKRRPGPYQLQAAIAAVHDEAVRAEDTDWPQILALYELLRRISDNPMVMLNHAIALAMVHGPEHGLARLAVLAADARLKNHHRLFAVRAHLRELAGDIAGAVTDFRSAATRTASLPERRYLLAQVARLLRVKE